MQPSGKEPVSAGEGWAGVTGKEPVLWEEESVLADSGREGATGEGWAGAMAKKAVPAGVAT